MKKSLLVLAAALLVCTGCRSGYNVKLSNGSTIRASSRPKLSPDKSFYQFKNSRGEVTEIPSFKIREIEAR